MLIISLYGGDNTPVFIAAKLPLLPLNCRYLLQNHHYFVMFRCCDRMIVPRLRGDVTKVMGEKHPGDGCFSSRLWGNVT